MPKSVYQFRVSLLDVEPEIWRTIQVPADYSFWDLHIAIQDSMGWLDCHLHAFYARDENDNSLEIGIPDEEGLDEEEIIPCWEIPIAEIFSDSGQKMLYVYDFGDDWRHSLVFEGMHAAGRKKYPRLVDGNRACPPEDCGGVGGYQRLVEAMKDETHEDREHLIDWLGYVYRPEKFGRSKVSPCQ